MSSIMNSIIFKHFTDGVESQYGGYMWSSEDDIQKAKDAMLEEMMDTIKELAKEDSFWIVKTAADFGDDPLALYGCPEAIKDNAATVGWKAHFPQMEPKKDYKDRMRDEYWQLKDRYNKLHNMCIKYEAGTLEFTPTCSLELLTSQKAAMGQYLHCLEVRAEIEGIKL